MIRHYVKIVLRGLARNRLYSFITLASLILGITSAILISAFVLFEFGFDQYHVKKDRIYRVVSNVGGPDADAIAKIPAPWGEAMRNEFPEVENVARLALAGQVLLESPTVKRYDVDGIFTDASILDIFSLTWLHGDRATALDDPLDMVVTKTTAQMYFGEENIVGQTLKLDGSEIFRITGVVDDVPSQSHFTFSYLRSIKGYRQDALVHWKWTQFYTYILMQEGMSTEGITEKLRHLIDKNLPAEDQGKYYPYLQPLTSIHLHSQLFREMAANGNIVSVWTFSAIALLILIIAGVNYTSLIIARATERSKEVGLRKVVGARRGLLVRHFLGESVTIALLSTAGAFLLAEVLLPQVNRWGSLTISSSIIHQWMFMSTAGVFSIGLGIVAGLYPAFVLSRFQPAEALKGTMRLSRSTIFRKIFIMIQFAISIVLLIAAAVIQSQLEFVRTQDMGFSREQLVTIPLGNGAIQTKQDAFKAELLRSPDVLNVSFSANLLGVGDWGVPLEAEGWPTGQTPSIRQLVIDESFITTYKMEILEGRDFSTSFPSDRQGAFIVNESAARELNWAQPLGKTIKIPAFERSGQVVGMVKDFHFRSFHEAIGPMIMYMQPDWNAFATVKISAEKIPLTLRQIEAAWSRFDPVQPFSYSFVDDRFESLYQTDQRSAKVVTLFSGVAIVISCLGLFGLAAYTVTQRTREVGIRKVLGATPRDITILLSSEMVGIVALANGIAWPVAYWAASSWLEQFAYRTDITWSLFAGAGLSVLGLAVITVLYHSIRATISNPVDALRVE